MSESGRVTSTETRPDGRTYTFIIESGLLHCEDGPAVTGAGPDEWWLDGIEYAAADFAPEVQRRAGAGWPPANTGPSPAGQLVEWAMLELQGPPTPEAIYQAAKLDADHDASVQNLTAEMHRRGIRLPRQEDSS